LPARFWLMSSTKAASSKFGLKGSGFLVDDVSGQVEHVLGDFDVLDLLEIFPSGPDFAWIPQQRPPSGPCPEARL
jgi:hypothetical protein